MRRAIYDVTVAGTNISAALAPVLLGLSITDNAGTHSDSANIQVDDTGGQIVLPKQGAEVSVALGWEGEGVREVFRGTVDEIRSSGAKGGGRTLTISAKGVNTLGKAKEGQNRHFDDKPVKDIMTEAGKHAGVTEIEIDPDIQGVVIPYIEMAAESFIHFGERLAGMLGCDFRVQGNKATLARRAGGYKPSVTAQYGVNLISWDITPQKGRGKYKKAKAKSYSYKKAKHEEVEVSTDLEDTDATITIKDLLADPDEAERAAKGSASTSKENSASGSIVIDGSNEAVPNGQCVLIGARPGIDGTYTIKTVGHTLSKGGGWITTLEIGTPQGEAGKDKRGKGGKSGQTEAAKKIDDILSGGAS